MGNTSNNKSRRSFLTCIAKSDSAQNKHLQKNEKSNGTKAKIKMLTPDGQLIEVDESIVRNSTARKATNREIVNWSENFKNNCSDNPNP